MLEFPPFFEFFGYFRRFLAAKIHTKTFNMIRIRHDGTEFQFDTGLTIFENSTYKKCSPCIVDNKLNPSSLLIYIAYGCLSYVKIRLHKPLGIFEEAITRKILLSPTQSIIPLYASFLEAKH